MLQGVMPGQLHTPVRVGRDLQHPLSASGTPAAGKLPVAADRPGLTHVKHACPAAHS